MNKVILRVGLALVSVAFLATSLIGQEGTPGGGTCTGSCDSCCDSARSAAVTACFSGSSKNLCVCLINAFVGEAACESKCAPPPKNQGSGCNNFGW